MNKISKRILIAVICLTVAVAAALVAGCSDKISLINDVTELYISSSAVSSNVKIISDDEKVAEVTAYFSNVEFSKSEGDENDDLLNALIINAYRADGDLVSVYVFPDGSVKAFCGDDEYYAEVGSADYDGLKALTKLN